MLEVIPHCAIRVSVIVAATSLPCEFATITVCSSNLTQGRMKPLVIARLFASTIIGAELRAQTLPPTAADSAAIRKVAVPPGGRVYILAITADTAIVVGSVQREIGPDTIGGTKEAPIVRDGVAFDPWEARVERRKGKWVLVRREMK